MTTERKTLLAFLLTGCMQTRYITKKYIKTKIENHNEGEFKSVNLPTT